MNQRVGRYVIKKVAKESFKAYIPAELPPKPSVNLDYLYSAIEKATYALAKLNTVSQSIPNTVLFIYMYVRKEALLSSQIEGTQSSLSDLILFENKQTPNVSLEDVEEVSNYVKAIRYGLERLKAGFPMSLRLIKEIHSILLSGGRGSTKLPGEFRRSQNWIGGTRPGNALFVPPPTEALADCLSNFEMFLHDNSLPTLIKAGIAHVQFETIHPFLDGNGRVGRLLIILLLCHHGLLEEPILYLSLYLKNNRRTYYNMLQEVRECGTWETWLEFFLNGVTESCNQAIQTTEEINDLFKTDMKKINKLGRARFSTEKVFEHLKHLPQVSVSSITQELNMSAPTARNTLNRLSELGILEELTNKKRDRLYVYKKYLSLLEEGAEPIQ